MQRIGNMRSGATAPAAAHLPLHLPAQQCGTPRFTAKTRQSRTPMQKLNAMNVVAAASSQGYDVYVDEQIPLEEGVRKHTLSVFVADEAGMINRVAGVFARRSANIESLAVGLTVDKALFTIVATGTDAVVSNLCKQLAKLVNVRYVENITDTDHVERELLLIKVNAPPGMDRSEVIQIAEIFRARILDVADTCLTMTVTGDPGKMAAFQKVLSKFGIVELVRTGRIALKRGPQLFEGEATWNLERSNSQQQQQQQAKNADGSAVPAALQSVHDVYSSSPGSEEGPWSVKNVLDAAYTPDGKGFEPYTLSIDVHDVPGVLNQVTGVFARRGYNIQSLAVGNSEKEGQSRITTVVPGDDISVAKLIKQLKKLVYVEEVTDLHTVPHVARELMLVKVNCSPEQRGELMNLAEIFRGSICDVSVNTVTIEVVGKEDKMRALKGILQTYGILEVARTGRIALARESGVDTKLLSNVAGSRIML